MFNQTQNNNHTARIITDVLLLVAMFVLPWYLFWLIVAVLLFRYEAYYEILFFAFLWDGIYSVTGLFWGSHFIATFSVLVAFFVVYFLKERIISYR